MPKILHLAPDEKFINAANWSFERAFPGDNLFIIFVSKNGSKLKYVQQKPNVSTQVFNFNRINQILSLFDDKEIIVLHGMNHFLSELALAYPQKQKFIYMIFGAEFYNNLFGLKDIILGEKTKKLQWRGNSLIETGKKIYRKFRYNNPVSKRDQQKQIMKAINFMRIIGIVHKEDLDLLKRNNFVGKDAQHFKFSYYPIEFLFKGFKNQMVSGGNILLGNSASDSNNHVEAMDLLKKMEIGARKILVPLSYGNKKYADVIVKIGKRSFGSNFNPIREFMPLDVYNRVIQTSSIVIMNHHRQQAVGNIFTMLWLGAKVYLDERNTLYHFFERIGIKVYSIKRDLRPDNIEAFSPLSLEDVSKNKNILLQEIGEEQIISNLRAQITQIVEGN